MRGPGNLSRCMAASPSGNILLWIIMLKDEYFFGFHITQVMPTVSWIHPMCYHTNICLLPEALFTRKVAIICSGDASRISENEGVPRNGLDRSPDAKNLPAIAWVYPTACSLKYCTQAQVDVGLGEVNVGFWGRCLDLANGELNAFQSIPLQLTYNRAEYNHFLGTCTIIRLAEVEQEKGVKQTVL